MPNVTHAHTLRSDQLERMQKPEPGLYPIYVRVDDANPTFQAGAVITLGAVRVRARPFASENMFLTLFSLSDI